MEHLDYIGDGVYVNWDGYQIWLAPNNRGKNAVALPAECWPGLLEQGVVFGREAYISLLRDIADSLEQAN